MSDIDRSHNRNPPLASPPSVTELRDALDEAILNSYCDHCRLTEGELTRAEMKARVVQDPAEMRRLHGIQSAVWSVLVDDYAIEVIDDA